jgi:hypothetical protein
MQKRNVNTLAYINQTKDICNPLNKLKVFYELRKSAFHFR